MNLSKKLILSFLASTLFGFTGVFASGIDHFEVQFTPNKVKVNESLDLTIEAVDKNNTTVLDYEGTILIFSESDPEAELPSELEENTYTFSAENQGVIKFENSVKFKSPGLQNIHIYDLNDDTVFGVAEADINEEEEIKNIDIEIVSPEDGLTLGKSTISVSGTTQKNHKIKITVNGQTEYTTTSNSDGIFEKEITDLEDGNSIIEAQVLDADDNVVGTSDEVNIKVELDNLTIKGVKLMPEAVDPENSFEVEVVANPGLTNVEIIVNDVLTQLEESKDGVYVAKSYAPKEPGIYGVDVKIQDQLGHKKTELGAASLTVNEIILEVAEEPEVSTGVVEEEINTCSGALSGTLPINGLKLVELKTKSILTWDEIEGVDSYNVYKKLDNGEIELIQNVEAARFEIEINMDEDEKYEYFAVKAVAKNDDCVLYEGDLSEATKIKTGPEVIILLILSLLIGGFIFMKTKKTA